jgi:large subunit ribosomal protein L17
MALLRNLATALFERERIRTTLMKAKELRPYAEKLITLAKRDENRLHSRRRVARDIQNAVVLRKLFDDLGARFAARPGGYTRILRLGPRQGDGAEMAIVELIGSEWKPEKKDEKGKKQQAKGDKAPAEAKPAKSEKSEQPKKTRGKAKSAAAG